MACPNCGYWYLHHDRVEVFLRSREDAGDVRLIAIDRGRLDTVATIPNAASGNPSARRHGLRVSFWCEGCGRVSKLNLAQHKGLSLLGWSTDDPQEYDLTDDGLKPTVKVP